MKTIAQIYIDVDVKERHKLAGTNISAACNEFLKTYFINDDTNEKKDMEKEVQLLRSRLAQVNAKLESQKQQETADSSKKEKERLIVTVIKLRKFNLEKQKGSIISGELYKALFDASLEEFGLSREELANKVF